MSLRVFVSSTFEDLKGHRAHVISELRKAGLTVDPMEDWTASTDEPKQFSQDRVRSCDLCVLLVARRRGHLPQGSELSVTQLEYRAALDVGMDILVFLLEESAPWWSRFDELEKDASLREWRAQLREHRGVGFFGLDPSSIAIAPAISRWLQERSVRQTAARAHAEAATGRDSELASRRTLGSGQDLALARLAPPIVPAHFRDREQEVERVAEGVRRGRWCALVAIGGSGKTAIAARIAADRSAAGRNVVWLGLAGTSDVDVPQEWLANAFGFSVRAESNLQQKSARLRGTTAQSSTLIVLDDPASDAQLSELMASIGPGNDVLITTREQLTSMVRFGVEIVDVPPLPTSNAADVLLALLAVSSDITGDRREWDALVQAVGNHPLSLEVLAGDLLLHDQVGPAVYLQDRIASGTWSEGDSTLARLRKSLVDSVARSGPGYDLAFAALGAFEGSAFSADAVAEVCAFDSVDAARGFLLELRRRLCLRRQASGLYSLHPFVAETARQLQEAHVSDVTSRWTPMRRHIAYYSELLAVNGGYEWNIERYPSLVPEERELVRAVDGAAVLAAHAEQGESETLRRKCAEMTSRISWYLHWRGHWDLRIRLCERVCAWAEQDLLPRTHPDTQGIIGNLYVDQGWIHLQRGDVERAGRCAASGQEWLRNNGDLMFAIELAGQVALRRRDFAGAINQFESLRWQVREGSRTWLVFSYRLADALYESGDSVRGVALLEDLLQRTHAWTAPDVRGRILYRIALRRYEAGNVDEAITFARQATTAFAGSGIIAPERLSAITLLADLLSQSGAAEECRRFLTTVREHAQKEGDFETFAATSERLATQKSGTVAAPNHPPGLADL